MRDYLGKNRPGYSFVIASKGKIIYESNLGLADLGSREEITTSTSFRIASLTKQFTSMAILILCDKGKLGLDDTINKFFPDCPVYWEDVTIKMLLSHTSGMPDHEELLLNNTGYNYEPNIYDSLNTLKRVTTPRFKPGSKYEYSNSGYVLLALIIEKVSDMGFVEYINKSVFEPLGLIDTLVVDKSTISIKNRAIGYSYDKKGVIYENDYDRLNYILGDEGIYSSTRDLVKWVGAWRSEKLVSKSILKEALDHSLGWALVDFDDRPTFSHTGDWVGFNCAIVNFLDKDESIIFLSNVNLWKTKKEKYDFVLRKYLDGKRG